MGVQPESVFCRAALGTLIAFASTAHAEPLPIRDENVLTTVFGAPPALPALIADSSGWSTALDYAWSSTEQIETNGSRQLIVDAESQEARLTLARTLGHGFAVQVRAPYRRTNSGSLDSFIDDWHSFFSLPEGSRPDLPRDDLRIRFTDGANAALDVSEDREGLGDIAVDLGYALQRSAAGAASVWLTLDLPTGDADELTGNEALDVNVAIATQRAFSTRWQGFAQGAFTYAGEGQVLADRQKNSIWSAVAGLTFRAGDSLDLTAQVNARTAVFDDDEFSYLGESIALALGGEWRFARAWRLLLAVTEDIAVDTTADVSFFVSLRYTP